MFGFGLTDAQKHVVDSLACGLKLINVSESEARAMAKELVLTASKQAKERGLWGQSHNIEAFVCRLKSETDPEHSTPLVIAYRADGVNEQDVRDWYAGECFEVIARGLLWDLMYNMLWLTTLDDVSERLGPEASAETLKQHAARELRRRYCLFGDPSYPPDLPREDRNLPIVLMTRITNWAIRRRGYPSPQVQTSYNRFIRERIHAGEI